MTIYNPLVSLRYCEKEVRSKDIGCFIHGLFFPEEIRIFYYALHAFRLELVQSREMVNNTSLISTKMSWWEENLDAIWKNNPVHEPISISLNELRKHHVVRHSHFERMIKGSFEEPIIKNLRFFDRYIDNNYTMTFYIMLEILHYFGETEFEAATYAGRAWGISQHLLKTKYFTEKNRYYFPQDIMEKYGIKSNVTKENEENNENEIPESFFDLVLEIAAYGKENLAKAREFQDKIPKYSNLVFLQTLQAEYFYKNIEKYNFDVFNKRSRKMFWPSIVFNMVKYSKKGIF